MTYQKICDPVISTKGFNIVVYDIHLSLTEINFMMIVSANSTMHIQGICQNVKLKLKEKNIFPLSIEGDKESNWILMDYKDTILHVMTIDFREKYNLEALYEKSFQAKKILT